MQVVPFRLPLVEHPAARAPLYPHQVALWDEWEASPTILLSAKTGAGKTRAAMLPILKRREWAVAVYPTNELLRDQVQAVARFASEEGARPLIWTPEAWANRAEAYSKADCVLVPVDADLLDRWQEVMCCRSRGETLRRLLDPDKPKIVFTNPDILFLVLGLRYHAEPFEALRRYATLIADEFHLYQGVELAHALVMIALARGFGIFRRLVLLSATPHPETKALLEEALAPKAIESEAVVADVEPGTAVGNRAATSSDLWRIAVHGVEVTPVQVVGDDPVEVLVPRIVALKPEIERLRLANPENDYLPAVVILNSVASAIRLEDRLVESGFPRDSLAIIRGLTHRAVRDRRGKLLALGTSAIEVGVDFHCDYLLFEASEAASFLQRFGRVGRHRPGKAVVLVPPNAFRGLSGLPATVDRSTFEERIHAWYPHAAARPWFVTTEHGMITARATTESLIATVSRDGSVRAEMLGELRATVDTILADHAHRLGCSAQNLAAKGAFERCASGKRAVRWIDTYRGLNRFRTSLPSVRVHDFMEQGRRREWLLGEYDIDLAMLLRRGVGLAWNEKLEMLTIRGIGRYRRVHASELFKADDCDMVHETVDFPNLLLYQDGEATPVSDLMGRENHIFTVAPRADVEGETDWRLPVFETGTFLLAFDGAALLLLEAYRRRRRSSS